MSLWTSELAELQLPPWIRDQCPWELDKWKTRVWKPSLRNSAGTVEGITTHSLGDPSSRRVLCVCSRSGISGTGCAYCGRCPVSG